MTKENILITGASSGVGFSLVNYYSDKYNVIALARNGSNLKGMKDIIVYEVDLNHTKNLDECLDAVVNEHGHIPYLINNAGIMINSSIEDLSLDEVFESFRVNTFSPLQIMQKLVVGMKRENFGRIINITSGAPLNCSPNYSAYSASKAALNAFTITAAKELKSYNIKINLMSPGPCKTKMAPQGTMDPSVCHPTVNYLLELDEQGPSGEFFWLGHKIPVFPDLDGVNWMKGTADERFEKIK